MTCWRVCNDLLPQNEYVVNLIGENITTILPLVFGALYSNSKSHWNRQIHNLYVVLSNGPFSADF